MSANILDKKQDLIKWLSSLEDIVIIEKFVQLKQQTITQKALSMEEKKSIEKGIQDADNKKTKPHSEVRNLYENYL